MLGTISELRGDSARFDAGHSSGVWRAEVPIEIGSDS